jgi:hypothetical protein
VPTPNDAMTFAKRFIGRMPVDDAEIKLRILDDAHRKLWTAAPWRWTIGSLDTVQLVNDQQDYVITPVADVQHLVRSTVHDGQNAYELAIESSIMDSAVLKGRPDRVAMIGTNMLRFLPVPKGYTTGPTVISLYKKQAVAIDGTNVGSAYSTLGIPDDWFWVYQEIVLLRALQFANSPRVGSVAVAANGMVQYSGQYAAVEAAINEMRQKEPTHLLVSGERLVQRG